MIRRVKRVRRGTLGRRWGHPRRSASRAVLFGVPFDFFGVVEKESAVLERVEIYAVPPLDGVLRHPEALRNLTASHPCSAIGLRCNVRLDR